MGRSHTSLSRELERNSGGPDPVKHYSVEFAERQAKFKRYKAGRKKRLSDPLIRECVLDGLKSKLSPNIVSGILRQVSPELSVCHETIYQYIYQECPLEIVNYLPTKRLFRKKRGPKRKKGTLRDLQKTCITERDEVINTRKDPGHWESDSIVSKQSKVSLNVAIERKSRFVQITKIADTTAQATYDALSNRLSKHGNTKVKSITFDNGTENAKYKDLEDSLGIESYFCLPYHSWEKGAVENVNKMIRKFIPKKTDISKVSIETIHKIEDYLNHRPRKILDYQSPYEVFNSFP